MNFLFNKISYFNIRENHILYTIFFLAYGFYAVGTDIKSNFLYFHIISPIIFIFLIFFFNKENEIIFNIGGIFKNFQIQSIIYLLIIIATFLFFSWERLFLSIADDEYAYTSLGLTHSNLLSVKIAENFNFGKDLKVSHIYQILSLFFTISIFLYLFILFRYFKNNKFLQISIIALTVLILRVGISKVGGNVFPHPPLIGIPSLISVSFFGLSDLVLKLSHFVVFIIFGFYFFNEFKKKNNWLISLLLVISILTLPGVLFLGISYEQALWSMICYSVVLNEIHKNDEINYKKIYFIILIFSFFRILSLSSTALIFIYIIFNSRSIKDFILESLNALKKIYPLFLLLPFIIFSFTEKSNITVERVGFNFLSYDFFINELTKMIIDSYSYVAGFLIFILIFLSIIYLKKTKILLINILLLIIIYSGVILQNSKYLYEIFLPFFLLSAIILTRNINIKKIKYLLIIILISMLPINLYFIKNFKSLCVKNENPLNEDHFYETNYGCWIIDASPFNLNKPYKFLKAQKNFNFENLYVPGAYYGVLPSIINGMKLKEIVKHRDVNKNQNYLNEKNNIYWISADAQIINKDENIDYVLVADMANYIKLYNELIALGWIEIFKDVEKSFKTQTIVLSRPF